MATWRDGPEYAPTARPDAFVEPVAQPLDAPEPADHPGADAPAEHPRFTAPEQTAPDLAALLPATVPERDPRLAFEVVTTALTQDTAWGAAHSAPALATAAWTPLQPFTESAPVSGSIPPPPTTQPRAAVNPQPFPAPGTPGWFAPPDLAQRYQPPPQVSLGHVVRALTPGVLIALLIGALLNPMSVVMLGLSFVLSSRIAYRRKQVQLLYLIAMGLVGLVGGATLVFDGFYLPSAWSAVSVTAQAMCWLLPFGLGLVIALALGKGERPGTRP